MNTFEIRQQITQSLEDISPEYLALVADFVEFLRYKQLHTTTIPQDEPSPATLDKPEIIISNSSPSLRGSTAKDLLEFAGTWEGDDIRECLQLVHDSRAPLEF